MVIRRNRLLRFCETFTVPVTVTLHKIRLNKMSNERNLDVNKLKLVFFAVSVLVCLQQSGAR